MHRAKRFFPGMVFLITLLKLGMILHELAKSFRVRLGDTVQPAHPLMDKLLKSFGMILLKIF